MGLKHTTQATGTNDAGKQVSVNAWNEDHTITDGVDFPAENPAQPTADKLRVYGRKLAGRMMLAFKNKHGIDTLIQPYQGDGQIAMWQANHGSTSLSAYGAIAGTNAGTATNANMGLSSKVQSINAVELLVTTAATTALASWRFTAAQWVRGNSVSGGFFFHMRNAPATGASNTSQRFFIGMRGATGSFTDVDPSTMLNCIGFGWDSADANCQFIHNDASGVATKIDLGAGWEVPVTDRAAMYDVMIYAPPNNSSVFIYVKNLATGLEATAELSIDLPTQTTYLTPGTYASVGGVSSVVGIRFASCYLQGNI